MEAESGIGTASRAAPESIKEVITNVHFHATQWYPIVAGSGIGTASRAAHKSMIEDIPAIMLQCLCRQVLLEITLRHSFVVILPASAQ